MSLICGHDTRVRESYYQFIQNIAPCSQHKRNVQFVCLQKQCENDMLLCSECILGHRNHSFDKVTKFIGPQQFERIKRGHSRKHHHFDDMAELVTTKLNQIQQSLTQHIINIKSGIKASTQRFIILGAQISNFDHLIDKHLMLKIKKYLEEQWSYTKCEKMKEIFDKVINAIQDSFENLAEDLLNFIEGEDWENIQETQFKDVQEKWFNHLHSHTEKIVDYFKFDPDQKASNIKIGAQRLQAQYLKTNPGTPFLVCDNFITQQKNKWKILIKQCDSKMLFFNASNIFVGACKPQVARRMNYIKLNEGGRGTYLIGSNGWSYHHTDPALDRQDIVGFTFGKNDEILIQMDFKGRGKLKFIKIGKIYDNHFQLPLNLDQKKLSKPCLKPCVGFSDDIGVKVRIFNIS